MSNSFRPLNGVAHADRQAGEAYAKRLARHRQAAQAGGFPAEPQLNLRYFGGKTIDALTFVNLYVPGAAPWDDSDRQNIDEALGAAMSDSGLNNVLAQYFNGQAPTTTMLPSQATTFQAPARVYSDTVAGWLQTMQQAGSLPGDDFTSTAYCFMLGQDVILVDGTSTGGQSVELDDEDTDSTQGLGGYHGSIHVGSDEIYYAVGVYSAGANGIPFFAESWMNVVATFYHELNETRTDANVADAASAASAAAGQALLGWYSQNGGEIGDIPMTEAGSNLGKVMEEVQLVNGSTVPIQLMWSNVNGAPCGPVAQPTQQP